MIDILFVLGSILAVTSSTDHAPEKVTRFVGICILRQGTGLCSSFMLRNVVDNQGSIIFFLLNIRYCTRKKNENLHLFVGVEFAYELYDPKLLKIEVLRLEKRLDDDLLYLRDAEPEYSTFPFDMEVEFLAEGSPVPVNPVQVINKLPYFSRFIFELQWR